MWGARWLCLCLPPVATPRYTQGGYITATVITVDSNRIQRLIVVNDNRLVTDLHIQQAAIVVDKLLRVGQGLGGKHR